MDKKRYYSIAYLVCLVLLFNMIPFNLFIDNKLFLFSLNIIIKVLSIIYIFKYVKKEKLNKINVNKLNKTTFKLLPLLLLCVSNFIVVLISKTKLQSEINMFNIISGLFISIGVSIVEELLFRSQILEEFLNKQNKFKSILYSSIIFGSVHLLNISSLSSIPTILVQVCYTFFLGIVLGYIYTSSKNIILPITFHLSFNFLNNTLVTELFELNWNITYFITNIAIGICTILYIILLVKLSKKEDEYAA